MIESEIFNVDLNKDELIKHYADKIITVGLINSNENRTMKAAINFSTYDKDNFIEKNKEEIFNTIKRDIRVQEVSIEDNTISMQFYLNFCPRFYSKDIKTDMFEENVYLRKFIDFIKSNTNLIGDIINTTAELQDEFLRKRDYICTHKGEIYNVIKKHMIEIGFIDIYFKKDKYEVPINKSNIDELINKLEAQYAELPIPIKEIPLGKVDKMLETYNKDKNFKKGEYDMFYSIDNTKDKMIYLLIDNNSGELYIDEYYSKEELIEEIISEELERYDEEEEEEDEEELNE